MIIPRPKYLNQLISVMNTDNIKVVTGVRRCGKSYLLLELFRQYLLDNGVDEKHIIVMDLEDRRNKMYRDPEWMNMNGSASAPKLCYQIL